MNPFDSPAERLPWTGRQLLLGLCFAAAGLIAWWQYRLHPGEVPSREARGRLPDYIVSDFTAVQTDARGHPSRQLFADQLRHYVADDLSELDRPRMVLFQDEDLPWHARARQGLVLADGNQVRLLGEVRVTREGDRRRRSARLETERLDVWPDQAFAQTNLPVHIQSDGDSLTATGMRLWYAEPLRARFQGRAHLSLTPEPEAEP